MDGMRNIPGAGGRAGVSSGNRLGLIKWRETFRFVPQAYHKTPPHESEKNYAACAIFRPCAALRLICHHAAFVAIL